MATGALRIRSFLNSPRKINLFSANNARLPAVLFRSQSTTTTATATTTTTTSSVSPEEVSKFSSMSPTWWDASQNPLLSMNPIRIRRMLHVLNLQGGSTSSTSRHDDSLPLRGLTALDVGCGGGVLSESLARLGASVTAVDPSVEIVDAAREHANSDPRTATIDYRGGVSVEELWHDDGQRFDIVCILEVVEHTADPSSLIRAAARLLKRPHENGDGSSSGSSSGGIMFVSTINRTPKSFALGILGAEYMLRMLPPGTHDWSQFRSPEEVLKIVEQQGDAAEKEEAGSNKLVQLDVCGMVASPDVFTKSLSFKWSLDPYDLDINWIGAYGYRKES